MKQEHLSWLKKTAPSLLEGMLEHAKELDERGERHLYGTATNHIRLLLECVEYLGEQTMKHGIETSVRKEYTAEDVKEALTSRYGLLRQFRHNTHVGYVFGYPAGDAECVVAELINVAVKAAVKQAVEAESKAGDARVLAEQEASKALVLAEREACELACMSLLAAETRDSISDNPKHERDLSIGRRLALAEAIEAIRARGVKE